MLFKLFVYGTLKKGFPLHHYLSHARFLGEASLKGFQMYDLGWYPGIVPGEGVVYGEVYEVGPATLALLDEVEEEYERKLLEIVFPSGEKTEAFVYIYQGDIKGKAFVPKGCWEKINK